MKPFHTIAIPHKDILQGKLTMDVFAADLWEVHQKRGPDEYKDTERFFNRTHITYELEAILKSVEKRLEGRGGDSVIQLQTPFGGGKTHTLIALYHKSKQWGAKPVVICGDRMSVGEKELTLWEEMEKQITGRVSDFKGKTPPSGEKLRIFLEKNQPLLILIDEIHDYVVQASSFKVGNTYLSTLTQNFLKILSSIVSSIEKVQIVASLPSSSPYSDSNSEKILLDLQNIFGRKESIKEPVKYEDVTLIIRRRLFSHIDLGDAKKIVQDYITYAEKEQIIPEEAGPIKYRDMFLSAYPFLPDVIDVLYHNWGSFPNFQRTRGLLRLLSLVVYSLKDSSAPYITLSDFSLANSEIRQELIKHIGSEYNGIIDLDITGERAGAKRVDKSLGDAYKGLKIGGRAATAIFMFSFSGGTGKGADILDVKRSACIINDSAAIVGEALESLRRQLFYLKTSNDKYLFSNVPNIERIKQIRMENIKEVQILEVEKEILRNSVSGRIMRVFIWEEDPSGISDTEELKLVILKQTNRDLMQEIINQKGKSPRVNKNTILFLCPQDSEKMNFYDAIKRKIIDEELLKDKSIELSSDDRKEIEKEIKDITQQMAENIRRYYCFVYLPGKDGLKEVFLGVPTYGEEKAIDRQVYEKLRSDGEVLEKIAPLVIREKYLSGKDYVSTEQLYHTSFKTPGEARILNKGVLEQSITEGVSNGFFGLGEIKDGQPVCRYFNKMPSIAFSHNEVIIDREICVKQPKEEEKEIIFGGTLKESGGETAVAEEGGSPIEIESGKVKEKIRLKFQVPKGKVAQIMGTINFLQSKFKNLEIELIATEGKISEQDYEDKIKEAFRQLEIEAEE